MLLNDSSVNVPKQNTEELHQLDLCKQSKSQNQQTEFKMKFNKFL